jgi:hypothetical protein
LTVRSAAIFLATAMLMNLLSVVPAALASRSGSALIDACSRSA